MVNRRKGRNGEVGEGKMSKKRRGKDGEAQEGENEEEDEGGKLMRWSGKMIRRREEIVGWKGKMVRWWGKENKEED